MVEICPSIGPFVETARAHLRAHPVPTFTGEIMSEENLQLRIGPEQNAMVALYSTGCRRLARPPHGPVLEVF